MKKLLFFVAAMCLSFPLVARVSDAAVTDKGKSIQDIQIEEAAIPATTVRPRSAMPYTQAWIDYGMESIEVAINGALGVVSVAVTDMTGACVSEATVDSEMTPYVTIPMPAPGVYRLTITGDEYLGEGDFVIE